MRLELRHLEVVCSIADHGSLNKAASALGLAPSALTTQLQRIERNLGGSLFDRDRRGARPTPLGDLVLKRARALIPAVEDLHDAAVSFASDGDASTTCRIGAVRSPLLAGIIRRFANAEPEIHATVHQSGSPAELAGMLSAGRVDYVVIGLCGDAAAPSGYDLVWQDVAVEAVFVLVPADHPAAQLDEVDLAEFADATWAAGGPYKCCFDACFAAACAKAGFTMRGMYELDVRTAVELTIAGQVVCLCQSSFQPPAGLRTVPLTGTPLTWRHVVGWRSSCAPLAEQVMRYAAASYADVVRRIPLRTQWLAARPALGARERNGLIASR